MYERNFLISVAFGFITLIIILYILKGLDAWATDILNPSINPSISIITYSAAYFIKFFSFVLYAVPLIITLYSYIELSKSEEQYKYRVPALELYSKIDPITRLSYGLPSLHEINGDIEVVDLPDYKTCLFIPCPDGGYKEVILDASSNRKPKSSIVLSVSNSLSAIKERYGYGRRYKKFIYPSPILKNPVKKKAEKEQKSSIIDEYLGGD